MEKQTSNLQDLKDLYDIKISFLEKKNTSLKNIITIQENIIISYTRMNLEQIIFKKKYLSKGFFYGVLATLIFSIIIHKLF